MLKVTRWIFFGAVVSILPLVFTFFDLEIQSKSPSLSAVIGNGELLVIVWVLSAGAIGELFGTDGRPYLKVIFGALTLISIVSSAHFFAAITEARASKVTLDEHFIVSSSLELFIFSLAPAAACLWVTE